MVLINYLKDFQQADKLKSRLLTAPGVLILGYFVTNMVLNGW